MDSAARDFGLIHIPKTGGISIQRSFRVSSHHLMCEMHKPYRKLTEEQKNSFTFLSVVRNPFDRIYSFYHYFLGESNTKTIFLGYGKDYKISFDDFIIRLKYFHVYIKPAWDFITIDDEIKVDDILRFESLETDFENLCHKYELDLKLAWSNKNPNKPSIDKEKIYKPYQITLIENLFSKDFENFGYSYQSWVESDSFIS